MKTNLLNLQKRDKQIRQRFPAIRRASGIFYDFLIVDYRADPEVNGVYLLQILFKEEGDWGLCIWNDNFGYFVEEPGSYEEYDTTEAEMESKYQFKH